VRKPGVPYRIAARPVKTFPGLVCPRCRQAVTTVEYDASGRLLFQCPECGNRWAWSARRSRSDMDWDFAAPDYKPPKGEPPAPEALELAW
jgi:predicted RNA-binding Zn-ribbon protein involved in translation (DUF1610 family)